MQRRRAVAWTISIGIVLSVLGATGCISSQASPDENPFDDPGMLKVTAYRQLHLEQFDQAIRTLRMARHKAPDDPEIAQYLGFAYIRSGLSGEAILVLTEALENNPDIPELLDLRGVAYLNERRHAEAAVDLERALDPALAYTAPPITWTRLGEAYWGMGDIDKATTAFRKAITFQPRAPLPRISLVQALEELGRTKEALKEAHQLVFLLPEYGPGHFLLGRIQLLAGEKINALGSFRKYLTLYPTGPNAAEAQGYVKQLEQRG